jgi:hypothetical protein
VPTTQANRSKVSGRRKPQRIDQSGLIGEAAPFKDKRQGGTVTPSVPNQWQHPYLAGLQGLCSLGRGGF